MSVAQKTRGTFLSQTMRHKDDPPPPPLCDIPSGGCFFTRPWAVTRSSLRMLRRGAAFCRPLRFLRQRGPEVSVLGVVLVVGGIFLQVLLPTPRSTLVVHHLPRCVSVGTRPVGLLFL